MVDRGPLLFGLLGNNLGHSLSPAMFAAILPQVAPGSAFFPLETSPAQLGSMINALRLLPTGGFSVTIPYKVAVIPFLDGLDPRAEALGAVNCVVRRDDAFVGHNTDAPAFKESLLAIRPRFSKALILGAGGAARAVVYALRQIIPNPTILVAARRPEAISAAFPEGVSPVSFDEPALAAAAADCDLIVNCTPVGTWPHSEATPLARGFRPGQVVYDLVYNPRPTLFLKLAADAGAVTIDGIDMLARQASLALELWLGAQVSHQKFLVAALRAAQR